MTTTRKIMAGFTSMLAAASLCMGMGATANASDIPPDPLAVTSLNMHGAAEMQAMEQLLEKIMQVPDEVVQAVDVLLAVNGEDSSTH